MRKGMLFCLALALCLLAAAAAPAEDRVSGGFAYSVAQDGTVTVSRYTGSEADVTVPDTIEGYPVTGIAGGAFAGCAGLETVWLPESVKALGEGVFDGCRSLVCVRTASWDVKAWCEENRVNFVCGSLPMTIRSDTRTFQLNIPVNITLELEEGGTRCDVFWNLEEVYTKGSPSPFKTGTDFSIVGSERFTTKTFTKTLTLTGRGDDFSVTGGVISTKGPSANFGVYIQSPFHWIYGYYDLICNAAFLNGEHGEPDMSEFFESGLDSEGLSEYEYDRPVRMAFYDLDMNGTPELLLDCGGSWGYSQVLVYTYRNHKLVLAGAIDYYDSCPLWVYYEDTGLWSEYDNRDFQTTVSRYVIEDGVLKGEEIAETVTEYDYERDEVISKTSTPVTADEKLYDIYQNSPYRLNLHTYTLQQARAEDWLNSFAWRSFYEREDETATRTAREALYEKVVKAEAPKDRLAGYKDYDRIHSNYKNEWGQEWADALHFHFTHLTDGEKRKTYFFDIAFEMCSSKKDIYLIGAGQTPQWMSFLSGLNSEWQDSLFQSTFNEFSDPDMVFYHDHVRSLMDQYANGTIDEDDLSGSMKLLGGSAENVAEGVSLAKYYKAAKYFGTAMMAVGRAIEGAETCKKIFNQFTLLESMDKEQWGMLIETWSEFGRGEMREAAKDQKKLCSASHDEIVEMLVTGNVVKYLRDAAEDIAVDAFADFATGGTVRYYKLGLAAVDLATNWTYIVGSEEELLYAGENVDRLWNDFSTRIGNYDNSKTDSNFQKLVLSKINYLEGCAILEEAYAAYVDSLAKGFLGGIRVNAEMRENANTAIANAAALHREADDLRAEYASSRDSLKLDETPDFMDWFNQ